MFDSDTIILQLKMVITCIVFNLLNKPGRVDKTGFSHFYNLKEMNLWWQNFRLSSKEWESQFCDVIYRKDFTYLFISNKLYTSFLLPSLKTTWEESGEEQ